MHLIEKNDDFLAYTINQKQYIIHYSDLAQFWEYANITDTEAVHAEVKGAYIIAVLHTAGAQGGIIFIWDCNKHELAHVSDGSYAYAIVLYDNYVYALCAVSNFITNIHFELTKCIFGTMDAWREPEYIECKFSCDPMEFNGDFESIKLYCDKGFFAMKLNGNTYSIELTD